MDKKELKIILLKVSIAMSHEVSKALKKSKRKDSDIKLIKQFEALNKFRTGIFFK